MASIVKRFLQNAQGNVLVATAVLAPVLMGAAAYTTDYIIMFHQKSALQEAADAAAIASVKELSFVGTDETIISQVASSYVESSFDQTSTLNNKNTSLDIVATPSKRDGQVQVDISYTWTPFLAHLFDYRVTPIKVSATGTLAGNSLTCVVGLMQPERLAKSSIHMDDRSVLEAKDCAVFSNSVSRYGLRADKNSSMNAGSICSAGGFLTRGWRPDKQFSPKPITDCPKIEDPLADRPAPNVTACKYNAMVVNTDTILEPGVYCDGLTISGNSKVVFNPGIYVIKNGPFTVMDTASIEGEKVSFFLTGKGSLFNFQRDTTISLSAAEMGTTAGILFFEDRMVPHSFDFNPFMLKFMPEKVRVHTISSNNAKKLLGTLYLPKSILLVDADAPVANESAYTAIITGRLWLREGPTLVLNADYTKTSVPVPDGLIGKEPRLLK